MTIERDAALPASAAEQAEEVVRFVFGADLVAELLQGARVLLSSAPDDLAESFELALDASGLSA